MSRKEANLNKEVETTFKESFDFSDFTNGLRNAFTQFNTSTKKSGHSYVKTTKNQLLLWLIVDSKLVEDEVFDIKNHCFYYGILAPQQQKNDAGITEEKNKSNFASKLQASPRNYNQNIGDYFYFYFDQKYRLYGYNPDDLKYINMWLCNHLAGISSTVNNDALIYDYNYTAWYNIFSNFKKTNEWKSICFLAQKYKNQNSDLLYLLNAIDNLLESRSEYIDKKLFCNTAAEYLLRLAAISVMLTEDKETAKFRTRFRLGHYKDYPSLLSENRSDFLGVVVNSQLSEIKNHLISCYKELIVNLYGWANGNQFKFNETNKAEIQLYLEEFIYIYTLSDNIDFFYENLDCLFREKFFFCVNNPDIQEEIIFPEHKRFSDIFKLYDEWVRYLSLKKRYDLYDMTDIEYMDSELNLMRHYDLADGFIIYNMTKAENTGHFYEFDVISKNYETGKYAIRLAKTHNHINEIDKMNNKPSKAWMPNIFIPSDKNEITYAVDNNQAWIIEDTIRNKIAGCAIIVPDKYGENYAHYQGVRLCADLDEYTDKEIAEFNSVIIKKEYHGMGFQRLFLRLALSIAKQNNADILAATVSPDNKYSYSNFIKAHYIKESQVEYKINEMPIPRDLVILALK